MPARRKHAPPDTAVTYIRVSTEEQTVSGLGLADQTAKVRGEVERKGWTLVAEFADEGVSAKTIAKRPGLLAALEAVETGQAQNLVVMKLDRISRSVHDFSGLLDRSKRNGWNLRMMDPDVDTSTASGEVTANIIASFAQFERRLIGERTSAALQAKLAQGAVLGRPDRHPPEVRESILAMRAEGMTYSAVANELNTNKVPTSQGGVRWYPATVRKVERRKSAA